MKLHPLVKRWDKLPKPYAMLDAVQRSRLSPDSFQCPLPAEIAQLKVDAHVKICIVDESITDLNRTYAERFWVRITALDPKRIVGVVDNDLVFLPPSFIKLGDVVALQRRHILNIYDAQAAKEAQAHARKAMGNIGMVIAGMNQLRK